jgi:hypothetical protein
MSVGHKSVQKIFQLSVFLENRVGLLLQLSKLLEENQVHICGLSIIDTADSAIVRMVVDNVAAARSSLKGRGLTVYETDLVGVEMPIRQGIDTSAVFGILLRAEINVHYVYPLICRVNQNPVLAFHVDNTDLAAKVLLRHELELVGQDDIVWEGDPGNFM